MTHSTPTDKPKLIILSDLWGKEKSAWINSYISLLDPYFLVTYYDCCELGEIDKSEYMEEKLHFQFTHGGIDKAVQNLLSLEKQTNIILGFSIGGTIAWKASNAGLKIKHLFAISSTRLRYETQQPFCEIKLIFGENDANKPNDLWFEKFKLTPQLYLNESHEFFKKNEIAKIICDKIVHL